MHWKKGDNLENVLENRRLLLHAMGFPETVIYTAEQVHGVGILDVDHLTPEEVLAEEADGLITSVPGRAIGVTTADCLPVLLAAPDGSVVAALHAGWRGLVDGICRFGLETLCQKAGCKPEDVWAAVGPGIGSCCFEIGPEVAERMQQDHPKHVSVCQGRILADLPTMAKDELLRSGVCMVHHPEFSGCTFCRNDLFYSYRRDGWPNGLHLGVIGIRP